MEDGDSVGNGLKLSIITVSYNAAETIEQAIQSVTMQSYENIEYIVIDGGSNDGTLDIVRKYEKKIAYWISEPDDGIYDAMNKGIRAATGDYIYFLGADDCLLQRTIIEKVMSFLDEKPDILSAGVYLVDEELKVERYMDGMFAKNHKQFNGLMIPHQGMVVCRTLLEENKFDLKYKIAADYDFFLKCYLNKNITFLFCAFPVAYYSSGGVSTRSYESNNEYVAVMEKYHLPGKVISYVKHRFNKPWKQKMKTLLRKFGLMKTLLIMKGAEKHTCAWATCRWCGKKDN
mgnify:CR=1 FL=1